MPRLTLPSLTARRMNASRRTFAGGRPRIDAPRCPCAVMTLKRAQARGKTSEHLPTCAFYRQATIAQEPKYPLPPFEKPPAVAGSVPRGVPAFAAVAGRPHPVLREE